MSMAHTKDASTAIPVKTGERFSYLGVQMICTGNQDYTGGDDGCVVDCVKASYFNAQSGKFEAIRFFPNEYPGIMPHAPDCEVK